MTAEGYTKLQNELKKLTSEDRPKIIEAILNCCIPIMTDNITSRSLHKKGFPILIVNEWTEITEKELNENYDRLETEIKLFSEKIKDLDKWWNFSFNIEK